MQGFGPASFKIKNGYTAPVKKVGFKMNKKSISIANYGKRHLRLYKHHTLRSWKLFLKIIQDFSKEKNKIYTTNFSLHDYSDLKTFLTETRSYANNSICTFTDKLKCLIRAAGREGYSITNDLQLMMHISDESSAIYLTVDEIIRINKIPLSGTLDHIRDRFVIGCFTGLRFSDYSRIDGSNIKNNSLHVLNQKTNINVVIPLHPVVDKIFKKYKNKLPPFPSQWYFHKKLPALAARARINDRVFIQRKDANGKVSEELFIKHERPGDQQQQICI